MMSLNLTSLNRAAAPAGDSLAPAGGSLADRSVADRSVAGPRWGFPRWPLGRTMPGRTGVYSRGHSRFRGPSFVG